MKIILIALLAYLLGSFCASIPLSRRCCGGDVRLYGSGNAGATNMARVYGLKAGLATLLLDMLKTVAAMLLGEYFLGSAGKAVAGAFCIIGHCFPLYFGFRGGKGVSVGAALGLMTGLPVLGIIMAVFFATAAISRKVSLGSVTAAVSLPLASWLTFAGEEIIMMNVFSAALVVFMHRGNISRLIKGTEPDFHPKKTD
ncbi:MAG: glycerol-3-phosphate acyltransferase [Oscillospiraceae bacterium]